MTDTALTLESPTAVAPPAKENRCEERFAFKTVATVIEVGDPKTAGLTKKCWTSDLSPSGARLMSLEPIEASIILVQFLLPEFGDHYIQARIISRTVVEQMDFTNHRREDLYFYGLRFTRIRS